jgi:hypothetical protein
MQARWTEPLQLVGPITQREAKRLDGRFPIDADSVLENCRVQASRVAPMSVIPARFYLPGEDMTGLAGQQLLR